MSDQTRQTELSVEAQEQIRNQRILRGLTAGLQYLEDKKVIGPMHYFEGLGDLKWVLTLLLSGRAQIIIAPPDQTLGPNKDGQRIGEISLDE